ncbi:response regulator [Dyadobacter sp. CY323]|uniref:response regulator n=1 Tax=Dyadobacter sp. CY323 TaxID=2907302 RepID=UPI001F42972A|nr:response regulator [Dyadobacter sp. CY323]MCE6989046.1 response regulator [Dyadobacter sp. CY323]
MNNANYTGDFNELWEKESEIKYRWSNLTFCFAYLIGYPATAFLYFLRKDPAFSLVFKAELFFSALVVIVLGLHFRGYITAKKASFLVYMALLPVHAYILANVPHPSYDRATFNMTLGLIFSFIMLKWPGRDAFITTLLVFLLFPSALYIGHPAYFYQFMGQGGLFFFLGQLLFPFIMYFTEKRNKREFYYRYSLTEQNEKLEKQKEIAENATLAKSEFLSTMSHEIRTPLNGIVGIVHLLEENKARDEDEKELIETLKFSSTHLMAVVNDILDFNKINSNHVKLHAAHFDPEELFKNLYNSFQLKARERNLELVLETSQALPQLYADQIRLSQIITNLVHNAIKFTDKGFVKFSVNELSRTDKFIKLEFAVSDSGIGISDDQQSHVFEIFTQVKSLVKRQDGGTGLGLAISRELVRLFGGELKLKSEVGKGSVFSFQIDLPYSNRPVVAQKPVERTSDPTFGPKARILLVDDNATNLMLATRLLERRNIPFDLASDGKQAVEMYFSTRYDLIFMDLRMPVMDGFEATKRIRERDQTIPIVALTASAFEDERERALANGFSDYLVKPFLPDDFYKIVYAQIEVDGGFDFK